MDPEKYDDEYLMRDYKTTAKEKREKDKKRLEDIQQTLGCKIIVVWESTYRERKYDIIDYIKDLIEDHKNLKDITYI